MFSEETIAEIKAIPIAEVVNLYARVEVREGNGNILCPLHGDNKTPSLHLYHDTNTFYCFGCQAGGDVINFVQKLKGLSFWAACRSLAEAFNITVKECERRDDPDSQKKLTEEEAYYAALERVVSLQQGRWGEIQKSLPEVYAAMVARFGSPTDPESVTSRWGLVVGDFTSLPVGMKWSELTGVAEEVKAALLMKIDTTAMRGRVLIPIRNAWGRVVGFSARQIVAPAESGHEYPKYLTSRASRFFKKGELLFGLDKAIVWARKSKSLNIVEGYADVMTLHQQGVCNTIALQGTALTEAHLAQLKRIGITSVTLFPDNDEAGRKAVVKETITLAAAGFEVRVQLYGVEGDDPDSFFKAE